MNLTKLVSKRWTKMKLSCKGARCGKNCCKDTGRGSAFPKNKTKYIISDSDKNSCFSLEMFRGGLTFS